MSEMASSFVKVAELGVCYAQAEGGHFRLYKVDGLWAIYLVSKEWIWNEDNTGYTVGEALEGVFGGHISDPDNFEYGVEAIKEELRYLS